MLTYRNTPHCTTGFSAAALLLGHILRDKIPGSQEAAPNALEESQAKESHSKALVKARADKGAKISDTKVGDLVLIKQKRLNKLSTPFGHNLWRVTDRKGATLWLLAEDGNRCVRHVSATTKLRTKPGNPVARTGEVRRSFGEDHSGSRTQQASDVSFSDTAEDDSEDSEDTVAAEDPGPLQQLPRRSTRASLGRPPVRLDR